MSLTSRFFPLACFVFVACSSSDTSGPAAAGAAGAGAGGGGLVACSSDPRVQAWVPSLSAKSAGGAFTVTIANAKPNPPGKGTNAWTVTITDAQGQPVDGVAFEVKPYMVDHAHGPPVAPEVAPGGAPGTYDVTTMDLFMPGVWQLTFTVTAPASIAGSAVFTICVEG